jgi:hypothetical protein
MMRILVTTGLFDIGMAVFIGAVRKSNGTGRKRDKFKANKALMNRLLHEMGYTTFELLEVVERVESSSPKQALAYYRKQSDPWMAEAVMVIYGL